MGRRKTKPKLDQVIQNTQPTKLKVVKTLVNQDIRSNLHSRQDLSGTESWKSEGDADLSDDSEISDDSYQETLLRNQQIASLKKFATQSRISPVKSARIESQDIISPDKAINPQAILQTLSSGIEEDLDIGEIIKNSILLVKSKIKSKKKKMTNLKKLSTIYKKSAEEHDELLTNIRFHKRQVKDLDEENQKIKLQISKQETLLTTIPDLQDLNSRMQDQLRSRDAEIDRLLGKNIENLELSECFELYNVMNDVVKKLQSEVVDKSDRFQSLAKCVICMENGRCIILQPCGHFCMCERCGNTVCVCPVCRGSIRERIRALV